MSHELTERGIDSDAFLRMEAHELIEVGAPPGTHRRLHKWLDDCDRAIAAKPGSVNSPLDLVRQREPFRGGPSATAKLPGELRVELAREQTVLGAKLSMQLATHAARVDRRHDFRLGALAFL